MANISASYEEMRQQAQALRNTRDQITQELQRARMQVDNLVSSGFVTDSASGAFQTSYQEFTTSATKTIDALTTISQNLDQVVRTLEETDKSLASQLR
ncbi:WXG100 family type VII secretion target [Actinomyces sp. oral taxon 897]|jgi:WXG100 family type VII secretion target|uniref:WXG100 family type VII secretion target n=1 Tax=Actinomyces sp. oral taxon 897 TaxID=2081702 RepID=UPI000D040F1A|nr:WXG100 family type VII secretion target [Actinomyces sp. oral taxon 897]AVM61813.1 WXG100 family type VII secretion target [Actinomyces sp. oral taxon 897]